MGPTLAKAVDDLMRDSPSSILSPEASLNRAEITFFASLQNLFFLRRRSLPRKISRICAVDASYDRNNVVAVATEFADGWMAERSVYVGRYTFPYVSELLYLHEGPSVVEAVRRLKTRPQLVCFDAHGTAHPRSAGLAAVCGMILGLPSIGIAKSLLVGKVIEGHGDLGRMIYGGRLVGFVTERDGGVRYWSPGYSVSVKELQMLVGRYGRVCLKAMAQSHRFAREEIKSSRK